MGHDTPSYPQLESLLAMIKTAAKAMLALQYTDPTFHPSVETPTPLEPGAALIGLSRCRLLPRLGWDHPLYSQPLGIGFIVSAIDASVSTGLDGRSSELLEVMVQARGPLLFVWWIVNQDPIVGYNPSIHFIQPDFVPKLRPFVGFAPANDVRVRLKETDNLLAGRDARPSKMRSVVC